MHATRSVRAWVFVPMFGLAGFVIGCSDSGQGPMAEDKAAAKRIATNIRASRLEKKTERSQANDGPTRQGRGGR
jgi:hypothetical protein